ncbi:MAG: HD domain-containing protein [Candidatus Aenigmatarchaeota archaeon]
MKLIKKVEKYAKENLNELNYEHSQLVRKIAKKLAKKENANLEVVEIAALLHDIAREKDGDHHIAGKEIAKEQLQKMGADQAMIDSVSHCIEAHSMKTVHPDLLRPQTIEAKVLFEADMINLMSPFGIVKMMYKSAKKDAGFLASIEEAKKISEAAYSELQSENGKKFAEKYWKLNQKFFKLISG